MKITHFVVAALLLAGCATDSPDPRGDARFEVLSHEFVQTYFDHRPEAGVGLGWHRYDGQVSRMDGPYLKSEETRLRQFEKKFQQINPDQLSTRNQVDRQILLSTIEKELWNFDIGSFSKNPMMYAGSPDILIYLTRDFAPLSERVKSATAALRQTKEILTDARANLVPILPKPLVETAIQVADGSASFLENEALTAAKKADNPAVVAEFEKSAKAAAREQRAFADWLKKERLATANGSFAIGDHAYREMLAAEQIDLSPEEILRLGMDALAREQERFAAAARVIDPNHKPAEVYQEIQKDHPTESGLIPDTRKNLELIRQFVVDHHLVTIPSQVRATVEETPPPQRATSFASMSTPGPFETKATEAYYYVTPTESDWSAQRKEEWLTAFNYYTTDIVTIHEAYPGHYVQFLKLNASDASTVAKVFNSYAFVEGWAHYCEQMVVDEGFPDPLPGEPDHQLRAAKYQLAQSAEALLRYCRLVCSVRLHTQGMTVDEATHFFVENCHYAEEPSRQEAIRGTFDPGYLFYALGKLQILKLREDWRKQEGSSFTLQRFHDEFLSHGAPPVPVVRRLMLKDPKLWPDIL